MGLENMGELLYTVDVEFKAEPKKRPRKGKRGNIYSPSAQREETLAWKIKAQFLNDFLGDQDEFFEMPLYSEPELYFSSKSVRGDLDNFEKFIYDALEKAGIIKNDRQIRGGLQPEIYKSQEKDRVVIRLYRYVGKTEKPSNDEFLAGQCKELIQDFESDIINETELITRLRRLLI